MIDSYEEWVAFPHHEGFLRDILEHPFSDTPRLIYADWLEESGDEQGQKFAQFIRTQIELDGVPPVLEWHPPTVDLMWSTNAAGRNFATLSIANGSSSYNSIDANMLNAFFKRQIYLDVVIHTSRLSSVRIEDSMLVGSSTSPGLMNLQIEIRPRPWRARYNELVTQQHRLLVGGESPLFYDIASIPHVDEDGQPIGPKGRGGMVVYPSHEREPYCEFSPRIRQHFRRGFPWKVTLRTQEVKDYLPKLIQRHPITYVEISDLMVVQLLNGLYALDGFYAGDLELPYSLMREKEPELLQLSVSRFLISKYRQEAGLPADVFARNSQKAARTGAGI